MSSFSARAAALVKLCLFSLVIALALLGPGLASAENSRALNRIVVFGDSLSDPGNAFALMEGRTVSPPHYDMAGIAFELNGVPIPEALLLVPEAAYAGGHFSNGATWIELLGAAIGLGPNVKPAWDPSVDRRASNYAVAGATAVSGLSSVPLAAQVGAFLGHVQDRAPADALYVVQIGGNDLRTALIAALDGRPETDEAAIVSAAISSVKSQIERLAEKGATRFLVWSAPNIGRAPAIQRLDAAACPPGHAGCIAGIAATLTQNFNDGLMLAVGTLSQIDLVHFDAKRALELVQANPRRYGLIDASQACIQPNVAPLFRCSQPDRFFFWDGIHPTRAGHAIIAFLVAKELVKAAVHDD